MNTAEQIVNEAGSLSVSDLKKQRGSIKGRLTLFEKYVSKFENVTLTEKQQTEMLLRIEAVSGLLKSFYVIQDRIEQNLEEVEVEKQLEYRESFEDQYFNILSIAKCLTDVKIKTDKDSSQSVHTHHSFTVKLPEIKLPSFDGSYDHWLEYKNSYLSMIHKRSDLDAIQKFHYLKSSLSGTALQVISALEFTASNYTHAWELLENRYHNNRLLIHNHVKCLFSAPAVQKESPLQIRKIIDVILRNLRALKTLDEPTDAWDTLIIYIMVSKLDSTTEREWENYKGSINCDLQRGKIKLDDLLQFLRNRADMLDMIQNNTSKLCQNRPSNSDIKRLSNNVHAGSNTYKTHSFVSTRTGRADKSTRLCVLCSGNHALYTCYSFLNMSVVERIKLVESKRLCQNCLRAAHPISECLFGPCKQCRNKHNSLLHHDSQINDSIPTSSAASAHYSQPADKKPVSVVSCALNANTLGSDIASSVPRLPQVLLSTALVEVVNNNNEYVTVRALLDCGSQNSFINENLFKRLNISYTQSTISISGVGQAVSSANKSCSIFMRSRGDTFCAQLHCYVLPHITSHVPSVYIDSKLISIPPDICLADPTFNQPSEIELLIGADLFWELLNKDRIRLANGPYLQSSKLGWLLSGSINIKNNSRLNKFVYCNVVQTTEIDMQLRKFWELEEIGKSDAILTEDENKCEESFVTTTKRDSSGRFSVRIPLKESVDSLGDSYERAKSRFLSLERKLDRSPSLKIMYSDFMREYASLGHMSKINMYTWPYCFLPHHGVFKEHNTTTKLRVVFDASASTTTNKSLNDIQLVGPPLQNDIFSILLRFRQYKYVASADIEKMYRQILVQPDQRRLQLILWRENKSDEVGMFELNTVTYGTASAPYLSMRCLRQLAMETEDKVVAKVITEDFFVDDLITGSDDRGALADICERTSQLLRTACFPLRKWTFNHDVSIKTSKELAVGDHCANKTLGLGWKVDCDELCFTTALTLQSIITKRSMMSVISQIYDPLGLLSPAIILAKIMLQKLWLAKIDWDDKVPSDVQGPWKRFLDTLSHLKDVRVPRHVIGEHSQNRELHIFTDASQDAYGACAYIRSYSDGSPVTVRLLCAKSKVAPVKIVCTIPRLELCGALLGARLYQKIITSLRLTFTAVYFWTDSTIVMGWTRMSPHNLKTFVQNRVSQINELTNNASWLHIPGTINPADIVSRGLTLDELKDLNAWWNGPVLLQGRLLNYTSDVLVNQNQLPDLKSNMVSLACIKNNKLKEDFINFDRYSSFNRLRRSAAYVLRFINNLRTEKQLRETGSLSVSELDAAIILLARQAQRESFNFEYYDLVNRSTTRSKRLIGLNVFLDENKLMRVGGRLNNAVQFDDNKKHPVLLCSKNRFTVLLFRYEHIKLLHGGPNALLADVREAWWPLGGRNLARKTVLECVTCTRIKGHTAHPRMGSLPAKRLEPGFPFMRCGVDYAGPVMILSRKGRGATLIKAYICLFICLSTKAIHLELVTSLSTNDYILAIKRFISRRGKPLEIMSDNAKNFVGAEKEFITHLENNNRDILDFTANNSIKFSFIPPYSPHFGGLWEAGVKSSKYHLRRVVGSANLTYEEFSTVLAQTEAILNSRPLTALSTDPNDLQPLTPAHFLIGRPLTAPTCEELTIKPTHRLLRYDVMERMRQNFWRRWAKEYVSELQVRTKWKKNRGEVELNKLALIKDDNLPPLKWRLGRVVRIYPGTDGISRVADLLTASGITRRSFSKICPLPNLSADSETAVTSN